MNKIRAAWTRGGAGLRRGGGAEALVPPVLQAPTFNDEFLPPSTARTSPRST
jgi:hypothetical protein